MPSYVTATDIQLFSQVDYREGCESLIPPSLPWLFSSISFMIDVHP